MYIMDNSSSDEELELYTSDGDYMIDNKASRELIIKKSLITTNYLAYINYNIYF